MAAGTSPVGTWVLPNYTVDDPTTYKNKLDANSAVAQRYVDAFAPHPAASPNMTVVVDAGYVVSVAPTGQQSITEHIQQTVTISAAPGAPNNRIDLIVVDAGTGAASVIAGTPATSPSAPSLAAGKFQVAQVSVPNTATSIGAANITDLRATLHVGASDVPWAVASGTADAITATYAPAITALTDGLLLAVRLGAGNATSTPTFSPNGLTAHTITRLGGKVLRPGDLSANLTEVVLRYNLANSRWELLNPGVTAGVWAIAAGTLDAITVAPGQAFPAMYDGMMVSFRFDGAGSNTTTTPTLAVSGLTAYQIVLGNGQRPAVGDLTGSSTEYQMRFDAGWGAGAGAWIWVNAPKSSAPTYSQVTAALGFTPAADNTVGNYKGLISSAGDITLSASDAGKKVIGLWGVATHTIALPSAASAPGGVFSISLVTQSAVANVTSSSQFSIYPPGGNGPRSTTGGIVMIGATLVKFESDGTYWDVLTVT